MVELKVKFLSLYLHLLQSPNCIGRRTHGQCNQNNYTIDNSYAIWYIAKSNLRERGDFKRKETKCMIQSVDSLKQYFLSNPKSKINLRRGLSRDAAAEYVGIGTTLFDKL